MRRRLEASPDRVYRAWSDPEELARWYPVMVEGGLAVGARSTLVWTDRRVWWDVVEAAPPRRFSARLPWPPDDRLVTTLKIDLLPAGYGTTLLLEDGPFPIGEPGGLDAWASAIECWAEALTLLRAQLDFSVDVRQR
jgi:uncharacterized protein YndB with AHSA1/START domain